MNTFPIPELHQPSVIPACPLFNRTIHIFYQISRILQEPDRNVIPHNSNVLLMGSCPLTAVLLHYITQLHGYLLIPRLLANDCV